MNLLEQLREPDLLAKWIGPHGLLARAANEIERLTINNDALAERIIVAEAHVDAGTIKGGPYETNWDHECPACGEDTKYYPCCPKPQCIATTMAKAHVAAGTIALGEDQLDAAENQDYAERSRFTKCTAPNCLASDEECKACHFLYQKPAEAAEKRAARESDAWPVINSGAGCSEWVDWFRIEYRLTDRSMKLAGDHPEIDARLKEIHEAVYATMIHIVADIGRACTPPEEPPVAEAEDAAREVDPTEPEKNPLYTAAMDVGEVLWSHAPHLNKKFTDALMRFAHKLEDHIHGSK